MVATVLVTGLMGLTALPTAAATLYVGQSRNDAYRNVGDAYAAARNGDVISVDHGIYLEKLAMNKRVTFLTRNGSTFVGDCPDGRISVSAGNDQIIPICTDDPNATAEVSLRGAAFNGCGQAIASGQVRIEWALTTGPAKVEFSAANQYEPVARFSKAGTYVLQLQVSDARSSATGTTTVTVSPNDCSNPTDPNRLYLSLSGPSSGSMNRPLALNATIRRGRVVLKDTDVAVHWTDLATQPDTAPFNPPNRLSTEAIFSNTGSHWIRAQITELAGAQRTVSKSMTVEISPPPPPVVSINGPSLGAPNVPVQFSATVTRDGIALGPSQVSLSWTSQPPLGPAGSFNPSNGFSTEASFPTSRTYTIQVNATELDGLRRSVSSTQTIVISSAPPPVVSLSGPSSGSSSVPVKFCATVTRNGIALGPSQVSLSWTSQPPLGPTGSFTPPNGFCTEATFATSGTYTIQVNATELDGLHRSVSSTQTIVISGTPIRAGALDLGFDPRAGTPGVINALVVQNDRKVIIAGDFTSFNGVNRTRIARLNQDGSVDSSFNPGAGPERPINALAILPDGKIIVGGDFLGFNGTSRTRLVRLNQDGSVDPAFSVGSGPNAAVSNLVVQGDGKILVAGAFNLFAGSGRIRLARINSNGSSDNSFVPGSGPEAAIRALAVQSNGKILVAGEFYNFAGTPRSRIARLNSDGSVDPSFDPGQGPSAAIDSLAIQGDGKIIISGEFFSVAGTSRTRIARLTATGAHDTSFNPSGGPERPIRALAVQPDGKILIAGEFFNFAGTARTRIARLNGNGSLDTSFSPGAGPEQAVRLLALAPDNKALMAGGFVTYDGVNRKQVARLYLGSSASSASVPPTETPRLTYGSIGSKTTSEPGTISETKSGQAEGGSFPSINPSTAINGGTLAIPTVTPSGQLELRFYGIPGQLYQLLFSSDLISWELGATLTADEDGVIASETNAEPSLGFFKLEPR